MGVHVHACACICVLSFEAFLVLISGLTVVEWIFGSLFAVTPTCQAVDQVNGAWCLVLGPFCVEVCMWCQKWSYLSLETGAAFDPRSRLSVGLNKLCC